MAVEMKPRVGGRHSALSLLAVALLGGACQVDPDGFTEQDRSFIAGMALTREPLERSNGLGGKEALALGQLLFFEPDLSGALVSSQDGQPTRLNDPTVNDAGVLDAGILGRVSCADCHDPRGAFGDTRSSPNNVSLGVDYTPRNSPSLVNSAYYTWYGWDGRSDSLWMQCAHAYESSKTMAGQRLRLARLIASRYAAEYQAMGLMLDTARLAQVPGVETEWELADGGLKPPTGERAKFLNGIAANSYKALAVYISALTSLNAPLDRFAQGDETALSPSARRGLKVFLGRGGCVECHRNDTFTDNAFHSVGIGQRGPHVPATDLGREAGLTALLSSPQSDFNSSGPFTDDPDPSRFDGLLDGGAIVGGKTGQFRTKSLRNVAGSPPYMHAGQLATLEEVVRFYNQGGESSGFSGTKDPRIVPLGLSEAEVLDLVAFLESLSGAPVADALLCDPAHIRFSAHRFRKCN